MLLEIISILSYLFGDLLIFVVLLGLLRYYKNLNYVNQLDLLEQQNTLLCRIDNTLIGIDSRLVDIQNNCNH